MVPAPRRSATRRRKRSRSPGSMAVESDERASFEPGPVRDAGSWVVDIAKATSLSCRTTRGRSLGTRTTGRNIERHGDAATGSTVARCGPVGAGRVEPHHRGREPGGADDRLLPGDAGAG